jgi:hypothetical protein
VLSKLLLLSILAAMIAVPTLSARDPNPRRGFKRALFLFAACCVFYALALKYLYFRIL